LFGLKLLTPTEREFAGGEDRIFRRSLLKNVSAPATLSPRKETAIVVGSPFS
jgi:hypothetical protein